MNISICVFEKLVIVEPFTLDAKPHAEIKPPLPKGRWQKSLIFDGGIIAQRAICRIAA